MERIAPAHVDSPFRFRLRPPEKLPDPLKPALFTCISCEKRFFFIGVGYL